MSPVRKSLDDQELRHNILLGHERKRTVIEDPQIQRESTVFELRRIIERQRGIIKRLDDENDQFWALLQQPCVRCAHREDVINKLENITYSQDRELEALRSQPCARCAEREDAPPSVARVPQHTTASDGAEGGV